MKRYPNQGNITETIDDEVGPLESPWEMSEGLSPDSLTTVPDCCTTGRSVGGQGPALSLRSHVQRVRVGMFALEGESPEPQSVISGKERSRLAKKCLFKPTQALSNQDYRGCSGSNDVSGMAFNSSHRDTASSNLPNTPSSWTR